MTNINNPRGALESDEIDLIALVQGLWAQKWIIALVTIVVTLGAALYAFLSKPVYEARIGILPPAISDIAVINLPRGEKSGLQAYSTGDIYAVFTRNLLSEGNRRHFFREVYLPSLNNEDRSKSQDALYKAFGNAFKVTTPTKNQPAYFISVERHVPAQAAEWTMRYLDLVTHKSITEVLDDTKSEIEVRGQQIKQELKTLREFAGIRKNDRLTKLREALAVAESVGLVAPPVISGQIAQQLSAFMNGDLMYMRGTKALSAEIEALENRTSNDPFIPSLRFLEERYSFLNGVQILPENIAVSRMDGAVEIPDAPIKPRKVLILALGILLGGMLGIFIALARLIFSKHFMKTRYGA